MASVTAVDMDLITSSVVLWAGNTDSMLPAKISDTKIKGGGRRRK